MKVLLVDDDAIMTVNLSQFLQLHGHSVSVACDGAQAFLALKSADPPYDVMVTDMVMPVMSGPELIGKAREAGCLPPTIVVSGKDLWYGQLPGVIAALAKPVDPDQIETEMLRANDATKHGNDEP